MSGRRYYIVSATGELGPYTREELGENLRDGTIDRLDQVRSAMGTAMGTVAEVLAAASDAPQVLTDAASPEGDEAAKRRWLPLAILGGTLLAAIALLLLTRSGAPTNVTLADPPSSVLVPEPPLVVPPPVPPAAPPPAPTAPPVLPASTPTAGAIVVQTAERRLTLGAESAVIRGTEAQLSTNHPSGPCIRRWRNVQDTVFWNIRVDRPGRFKVLASYGCPATDVGSTFAITVAGNSLAGVVKATPTWETYREFSLGVITIAAAGQHQVEVTPTKKARNGVMNLHRLVLTPE